MKKRQYLIVSAGFAFIILITAIVVNKKLSKQDVKPALLNHKNSVKYVKVDTVNYLDSEPKIESYGIVRSLKKLQINAEVQGAITYSAITLKIGSEFKKGTLLFKLDNSVAKNSIRSLKSDFMKAVATMLPDLRIDYPNEFELWNSFFNNIDINKDLPDLPNTASTQIKTFIANKDIYKQYFNIKAEEERLKKYYIYAPFSGSISEINVDLGTVVNVNTNLATIIDSDNLEIEIPISVDELKFINKQSAVKIVSQRDASVREGNITRITDFISSSTQTVLVYASFKNNNPKLYDGSYVTCFIKGAQKQASFEIPRNSLVDKNQVYVLKDSLAQLTEVNVLYKTDKTALINGPKENDVIITEPLIPTGKITKYIPLSE